MPVELAEVFSQWKLTHNKFYATPNEDAYRLNVFHSNFLKISASNSVNDYVLSLNKFADLTEEEFLAKYTGLKPNLASTPVNEAVKTPKTLQQTPTNVDWRTQGAVNPVKNQGQCGSCWAFSAIAALESASKISGYSLYSMSEQQLVDCSAAEGNHGCNGGLMDNAFNYIKTVGGIQNETTYPYRAIDEKCKDNVALFLPPQITSWVDIVKDDCASLLTSIVQQPVSVAIAANAIQFYTHGVFSNKYCGTGLDHGVTAIGYGTDTTANKEFWLVRNSWGPNWGEHGYIRMDRNIQTKTGICGICMQASYPVTTKPTQ